MEFEPRTVHGGSIAMFGQKYKHEALKAHNGQAVWVATARDDGYQADTHIVVISNKQELVCVMHQ